uniref:Replication factor A C-terminal domain-containing protein n=1 Tax=Lactuca sativa TaxID=4236 RepID=A0A9R1UMA2_LACSA|nr:hypothetical protein LSAT_V11C800443900 [Lactuca sativa]
MEPFATSRSNNITLCSIMFIIQTYKKNPNMVSSLDMILMGQQPCLMEELLGKSLNLVWLKTKENTCWLVTSIRKFLQNNHRSIDPFNLVSFDDLTAINFDTHVAFGFIGQVVSTDPMRVIMDNAREKRLMNIVAQYLSGRKIQVALWDGFALKLNNYISEHQNDNAVVNLTSKGLEKSTEFQMNVVKGKMNESFINPSINTTHLNIGIVVARTIVDMDLNVESSNSTTHLNTGIEIGLSVIATVIGFDLVKGWYSFYCRDCSKKVSKNDDDTNTETVTCDGCGGVSDFYNKVVIRVEDGFASFVVFGCHVKDVIHRSNQWLMEKISKI